MLRKSVVGLVAGSGLGAMLGFDEGNGGDMVFSVTEGDFSSSGLSRIVSGFGFVAGGEFTGPASSTDFSTASESWSF